MSELIRGGAHSFPDLIGEVFRIAKYYGFGDACKVRKINSGVMTYKYLLSGEGGDWIVRFYPESRSEIVLFESDLLNRLRMEGVPVPEVIGDSRGDSLALLEYLVYKKIPGVSLSEKIDDLSDVKLESLANEIVQALLSAAGVNVNGWGEIVNSLNGSSECWREFVCEQYRQAMLNEAVYDELGFEVLNKIRCAFDELLNLNQVPVCPVIAWGDLSAENIILDESGKLSGIVDAEGALLAESILSLGYIYAREPESRFCKSLIAAWPCAGRDKIELYALVRMLRLLKYAGKLLPTGRKRLPIREFLPGAMAVINKYS